MIAFLAWLLLVVIGLCVAAYGTWGVCRIQNWAKALQPSIISGLGWMLVVVAVLLGRAAGYF